MGTILSSGHGKKSNKSTKNVYVLCLVYACHCQISVSNPSFGALVIRSVKFKFAVLDIMFRLVEFLMLHM